MSSSCRKPSAFAPGGFINRPFAESDLCWHESTCSPVIDFFPLTLRTGSEVWYMISTADRSVIWRKVT